MGQICSNCSKEEPSKADAFAETSTAHDSHHSQNASSHLGQQTADPSSAALNNISNTPHAHGNFNLLDSGYGQHGELDQMEESDRQRRLAQFTLEQTELARREAIVNTASQSMVPIGSQGSDAMSHGVLNHPHHRGGGINTYYDPAYAAAAAQDILRSAAVTGGLVFFDDKATQTAWNVSVVGNIPVCATQDGRVVNSKDALEMMGRGRWDGVRLGSRGSGLAGCGGEDPEYYLDDLAEAFLDRMVPTKTSMFGGCSSIVENLP